MAVVGNFESEKGVVSSQILWKGMRQNRVEITVAIETFLGKLWFITCNREGDRGVKD